MADAHELDRTEEPTPKRLEEARRVGDVPVSRDATFAAALAGAVIGLAVAAGAGFAGVAALGRAAWGGRITEPLALLYEGGWIAVRMVAPVLLGAVGLAVAVGALQTRGLFASGSLGWSLRWRIAPRPWNVARSVLLLAGVFAVLALFGRPWVRDLVGLSRSTAGQTLERLSALVISLCGAILVVTVLLGLADAIAHRWMWRRRLRMTKREVQRERRESEGDPWLAEERRRVHRELAGE